MHVGGKVGLKRRWAGWVRPGGMHRSPEPANMRVPPSLLCLHGQHTRPLLPPLQQAKKKQRREAVSDWARHRRWRTPNLITAQACYKWLPFTTSNSEQKELVLLTDKLQSKLSHIFMKVIILHSLIKSTMDFLSAETDIVELNLYVYILSIIMTF